MPDLTGRLDERTRREAAEQWPAWWRDVLTREGALNLRDSGKNHTAPSAERTMRRARDMARLRREFIDPPEWDSLSDRPALQTAARACYTDGCRWADTALHPVHRESADSPIFEWHVVRDAAEAVAAGLGVDIGDINGRAIVLAVTGHWHELLAPGLAACSVSDALDPPSAAAILRETFSSWVTR
ncbi:MAG: hypothetical protein ACYCVZ_00060 [Streptosporangiaceae bacterium]